MFGDLEDDLLKQNIPGKWSTHNKYENDKEKLHRAENDDNNDIDDDCDNELENDYETDPIGDSGSDSQVNRTFGPNTGPKAVKADFKAHQKMERINYKMELQNRQQILTRMVSGYVIPSNQTLKNELLDTEIDKDDEDSDNDDDFLRSYRQKRLEDLKAAALLPKFNSFIEVTSDNLIEQIEQENGNINVVVHLFESTNKFSRRLQTYLNEIATSNQTGFKFLMMKTSEMIGTAPIDPLALPIMNIYRGGQLLTVLGGIAHEYGDNFTKEDVEWMLDNI